MLRPRDKHQHIFSKFMGPVLSSLRYVSIIPSSKTILLELLHGISISMGTLFSVVIEEGAITLSMIMSRLVE